MLPREPGTGWIHKGELSGCAVLLAELRSCDAMNPKAGNVPLLPPEHLQLQGPNGDTDSSRLLPLTFYSRTDKIL